MRGGKVENIYSAKYMGKIMNKKNNITQNGYPNKRDVIKKISHLKERRYKVKIGNSGTFEFNGMTFHISKREFKEAVECNMYLNPNDESIKATYLKNRLSHRLIEELTYKSEDNDKPDVEKFHEINYYIRRCTDINAPIDYTVIYTILCADINEKDINRIYLRKEELLKDYLLDIYKAKVEADLSEVGDDLSQFGYTPDTDMLKEAKNNKSDLSIIYDMKKLFKLSKGKNLSAEERLKINKLANFAQKHGVAATEGEYEEPKFAGILRAFHILPEKGEIEPTPDYTNYQTYIASTGVANGRTSLCAELRDNISETPLLTTTQEKRDIEDKDNKENGQR